MYVILVYDFGEERVSKYARSYERKYLNWIQNSVFEGEISRGSIERTTFAK